MFTDAYPQFLKGRLLKTEMLDSLRDYPRHLVESNWSDCSDGVISGAELKVSGDKLIVGRGIVKHQGRLYAMSQDSELLYEATGRETLVKLRFAETEPSLQGDFVHYEAEIVLDEDVRLGSHELELGRFKLKQGARLRMDYQSFADLATEYNTVNPIHAVYAGRGKSTLSPAVMRYYGSELLKSGCTDAYDIAFGMMCLNGGTVERELIVLYLAARLQIEQQDYTNEHLHRCLARVLADVQGGRAARPDFRRGGVHRVLVD